MIRNCFLLVSEVTKLRHSSFRKQQMSAIAITVLGFQGRGGGGAFRPCGDAKLDGSHRTLTSIDLLNDGDHTIWQCSETFLCWFLVYQQVRHVLRN